jgi:hypothetical protein
MEQEQKGRVLEINLGNSSFSENIIDISWTSKVSEITHDE